MTELSDHMARPGSADLKDVLLRIRSVSQAVFTVSTVAFATGSGLAQGCALGGMLGAFYVGVAARKASLGGTGSGMPDLPARADIDAERRALEAERGTVEDSVEDLVGRLPPKHDGTRPRT